MRMLARTTSALLYWVGITSLSASATTAIQTYKIQNFSPHNNQEMCGYEIQAVAERFTQQTGIAVVHASCATDNLGGRDLNGVITYVADKPVAITSTRDHSGSIFNREDIYRNKQECVADMKRSTEQFEHITGLTILTAFCYEGVGNSVALQIDAAGNSDLRPFTSGMPLLGNLIDDGVQLLEEFKQAATDAGLEVRHVGFNGTSLDRRLHLYFYAQKRHDLHNLSDIKLENNAACSKAQSDLKAIFSNYDAPPVLYPCTSDMGNIRINIITLGDSFLQVNGFRHYEMPGAYGTHTACVNDIERVTDMLNGDPNSQVIGAICSGKTPEFRMQFFLKPKPI